MTVDLDALEALARAATPGPWDTERRDDDSGGIDVLYAEDSADVCICFDASEGGDGKLATRARRDSKYIAAASPTTTLALIARIRQLEQSNATKATRIAELLAAVVQRDAERPCCVHPVARHEDAGCLDCECLVRWPQHPDAHDDWSAKRVDRLNVATERAAGNPDYQPAWTRTARPEAK